MTFRRRSTLPSHTSRHNKRWRPFYQNIEFQRQNQTGYSKNVEANPSMWWRLEFLKHFDLRQNAQRMSPSIWAQTPWRPSAIAPATLLSHRWWTESSNVHRVWSTSRTMSGKFWRDARSTFTNQVNYVWYASLFPSEEPMIAKPDLRPHAAGRTTFLYFCCGVQYLARWAQQESLHSVGEETGFGL